MSLKLGILVSGFGTGLQALIDAVNNGRLAASIEAVISNVPDAYALKRAESAGIRTYCVNHESYQNRRDFDSRIRDILISHNVEWVALSGFMRMLGRVMLDAFPQRILNIHPALLPSFPGIHGVEDALKSGVRISGCTVHIVDEGMDTGPVLAQAAVPILPEDTIESLKARIQKHERILFTDVLNWISEGRLYESEGSFFFRGLSSSDGALHSPTSSSEDLIIPDSERKTVSEPEDRR